MKFGEITDKVSLPTRTTGKYRALKLRLSRLKVGESMPVLLMEGEQVSKITSIHSQLNKGRGRGKGATGPRYTVREATSTDPEVVQAVRVWRVE